MKILIIIAIALFSLVVGTYLLYKLLCKILPIFLTGFATAIASGIQSNNQVKDEAWRYWENKKGISWNELSDDEKVKIIRACMIIADDCGILCTEERVKELLQEQLPIKEPQVGLSFYCID